MESEIITDDEILEIIKLLDEALILEDKRLIWVAPNELWEFCRALDREVRPS